MSLSIVTGCDLRQGISGRRELATRELLVLRSPNSGRPIVRAAGSVGALRCPPVLACLQYPSQYWDGGRLASGPEIPMGSRRFSRDDFAQRLAVDGNPLPGGG